MSLYHHVKMNLSVKQQEYIHESHHRWNFKTGATRSGKTLLDWHLIPRRIIERKGLDGLNVILGFTKTSIQRNLIAPMQELYGVSNISDIRADNTCIIFGEMVYCLGASKISNVDSVRGSSIKYCYGDEVATWHVEVFEMLKSRLDKVYSMFEGTCNPKEPSHWLYKFLTDKDVDIYWQQYTIFDNPFLDEVVLHDIISSHTGVFKQRYIYGLWVVAEGVIFNKFANCPSNWYTVKDKDSKGNEIDRTYSRYVMGIDFGGNGSKTTMVLSGYYKGYRDIDVLQEKGLPITKQIGSNEIIEAFIEFAKKCHSIYKSKIYVLCDNASPTMINTLRAAAVSNGLGYCTITGCTKTEIADRPRFVDVMMSTNRFHVDKNCTNVINALCNLRWDSKDSSKPEDKNENNINDWYDAFCYSFTMWQKYFELER